MTETWVSLLIAGAILLIGFLASLSFDRFRIPDFIVLIALGIVLGHLPVEPFGSSMVDSLQPVLPAFTTLTLAFILFEGGLTFRLGLARTEQGAILAHILVVMALTMGLIWFLSRAFLHLDQLTSLVLGAAFAGPSATIAVSFANRLQVRVRASGTIVLEGVLTNVIAAVLVIYLLKYGGTVSMMDVAPFALMSVIAGAGAFGIGVAWHFASQRLSSHRFVGMATLAMAIVVYAIFQGFIGENGPLAAFVFGVAVGHMWPFEKGDKRAKDHDGTLKTFQSEVSFALRTFFFVYLGLLITFRSINATTVVAGVVMAVGMVALRLPTTLGLSYALTLSLPETRAVFGNVARGMTDVILVLLALQSGVLPPADNDTIITILTLVVLITAAVSAGILIWTGREMARTRQGRAGEAAQEGAREP